jgi:N-acyl-D-glutamate deacylase
MSAQGRKENYRLAQLAKKYDVPIYTHSRYVSAVGPQSTFEAIEELVGLAFNPGEHMHICHLNSVSLRDIEAIAQMIKSTQSNDANVTVEAYLYGAASTSVGAQFIRGADWKERLGAQASDIELLG